MKEGRKLNRTITFKISEEEDEFLDEVINRFFKRSGLKISKGTLIRRYCNHAKLMMNCPKYIQSQYNIDGLLDIRVYDVSKITNRKQETLKKKRKGELINDSFKVNKIMKFRLSEEDRHVMEMKKKDIEKMTGINLSMADFIRFCINAERDYMKIQDKGQENHKDKKE
ncbi:MAG TPA: hypothetical protein ACHBZ9_02130 [Arsenophonus nasoniae]|uniref:hypothetical protein n=1 Tax=Arsenophonus nasoniae TaxID=638 RepID=UPI003879E944